MPDGSARSFVRSRPSGAGLGSQLALLLKEWKFFSPGLYVHLACLFSDAVSTA